MKWLIAVFALCLSMSAQAKEVYVSVKAEAGTNHCAFFKGSFNREDLVAPQPDWHPWVACKLTSDEGSRCIVKGHGLPVLADPVAFTSDYRVVDGEFIIEGVSNVFRIRLICENGKCYQFQFWNSTNNVGYACDMVDYAPKPEPKAPPLLQKPNKSNEPSTKKSEPLSF